MSLYIEPYYNELFPGSCFPKATGLVVVDPQGPNQSQWSYKMASL